MRILADENISRDSVDILRQHGHDVAWVKTDAPGSSDEDVLARAQDEARTVITFDKDFGEPAFRRHLPAGSGIVLFRFERSSSQEEARIILAALGSRPSWAGYLALVDRHRIRLVPRPSTNGSRG